MATDDGTLGQILEKLTSLGERLAVVEADLKTVIRDHTKDLDDHEKRLRTLEEKARESVTQTDLDVVQATHKAEAASAALEVDRKANRRLTIASLALAAFLGTVTVIVNVVIALT